MYGFSMIQFVRRNGKQLDKQLREQMLELYRPFRWIPCFLHSSLEKILKTTKTYSVIIEFEDCDEPYCDLVNLVHQTAKQNMRCRVKHEFPAISCCSAELTPLGIERLLKNCRRIKKVHYDRKVKALLNVATPSIHADLVHQSGLTGKGVTIAVVDTGIYQHEDLMNPTKRIVAFKDFVNNRPTAYDDNGHGTHCAGDAAGNGYASGGQYQGPAPSANLIGVKVLDRMGSGSLSTVIAGVQWCIDNKKTYSIDIISMSLGSTATVSAAEDPVVKIVEKAWASGIVVCVAAGNEGPDEGTIASPGISPIIITVGAMDDQNTPDRNDDRVADFSSRGPTIDGVMKPDLLTPGDDIVSLRSPNSHLDKLSKSSRVGSRYFSLSGTSMATPICAGVAALILEKHKDFTPDQVKQMLLNGCENRGLPEVVQGHGYLDAEKALES
ncbi:S8 family peptidase [Paenibacillus alkaliterrae]|uniref:S8 family peptidase n=1 Tax=Paenibacillus alkaliterrae TaxID=320909 RepID=UPI001F3290B8|nr:S8 family peptidase [Paenibacillus alkaliterrae]MCF2939509.1 S8 family peptidase [Paenibacillus alkaliterrae]